MRTRALYTCLCVLDLSFYVTLGKWLLKLNFTCMGVIIPTFSGLHEIRNVKKGLAE